MATNNRIGASGVRGSAPQPVANPLAGLSDAERRSAVLNAGGGVLGTGLNLAIDFLPDFKRGFLSSPQQGPSSPFTEVSKGFGEGTFGGFFDVFSDPDATPQDKLNALLLFSQSQETEARQKDEAARGEATTGLSAVGTAAEAARAEDQRRIDAANVNLNARFDPILSQFSSLFETPAIDPSVQAGLVGNIRGQSARGIESAQDDIRSSLGGRGLSGSTLEAGQLAEARQRGLSSSIEAQNTLAALIAEINSQRQLGAASGGAQAAGAFGQLESGLLGAGLETSRFGSAADIGIQEGINAINLGQDFTPRDLSPFVASSLGAGFAEDAQERLDRTEAESKGLLGFLNSPEFIGSGIDLGLKKLFGIEDFFGGF